MLIVDQTGFLKKGTKFAGVARQYSGTAGRVENSQIGVFVAYKTTRGCAFVDRKLYLPKVWTNNSTRCREGGIPEHIAFATKPELARRMIREAIQAGVPAKWVTADAVYGNDSRFRRMLEDEGLDYVVAVSSTQRIWVEFEQVRVKQLVATLPATEWKRISCGDGTKGKRFYDWAFIPFPFPTEGGQYKGVLCRRSIEKTPKEAYYLCGFRPETSLNELVQVAGTRWAIESGFEQCKQEVGLNHYEVRTWVGWYRHITLALMAHAFLEVLRSESRREPEKKRGRRLPSLYHYRSRNTCIAGAVRTGAW